MDTHLHGQILHQHLRNKWKMKVRMYSNHINWRFNCTLSRTNIALDAHDTTSTTERVFRVKGHQKIPPHIDLSLCIIYENVTCRNNISSNRTEFPCRKTLNEQCLRQNTCTCFLISSDLVNQIKHCMSILFFLYITKIYIEKWISS